MTRAASFRIRHGGVHLDVRVLASVVQVDRAYRAGRRCRDRRRIRAYFQPALDARAGFVGTVVLPANGALEELVPHEIVHAVMWRLGGVHATGDEQLATLVGVLTARTLARLRRLGYGRRA